MLKTLYRYIVPIYLSLMALDAYFIFEYNLSSPSHFIFLIFLLLFLVKGEKINISWDVTLLLIIESVAVFSILFSNNLLISAKGVITIGFYILGYILIRSTKNINIKRIFYVYSIPLLALCIYVFISSPPMRRFTYQEDYNYTHLAGFLLGVLFLAYPVYKKSNTNGKIYVIITSLLSFWFIVLTQTRTALFSLILAPLSAYFIYIVGRAKFHNGINTTKSSLKNTGIFILFVIAIFVYSGTINNWLQKNTYNIYATLNAKDPLKETSGRNKIWAKYLNNLNIVPVGIGMAGVKRNWPPPHNNYIRLFVEGSFILLGLWLLFHVVLIRDSKNYYEFSIAIFFFIYALGNDMFQYKYYWALLYIYSVIKKAEY